VRAGQRDKGELPMQQTWSLGLVVLMCVTAGANAAEQKPVIPAELATPKAAAITFVRAMEADDMDAFRQVTLGNDEDYKLFEPLLNMTGAAKRLEKAARTHFGKEGSKVVRESPAVELEVHVQESDVKVNGDRATLKHKADGNGDALPLKKTAAGWKVDLTAIPNRQQMSDAGPTMTRMQQTLEQAAADILEGKFKTPDEAEKAVAARMSQAARDAK
jgi:hypothetical protein